MSKKQSRRPGRRNRTRPAPCIPGQRLTEQQASLFSLAMLESVMTWFALDLGSDEQARIVNRILTVVRSLSDRWNLSDDDSVYAQDIIAPAVMVSEWLRDGGGNPNPDAGLEARLRDLNEEFSRRVGASDDHSA